MSFDVIETTVASAVANGGNFAVGYPSNRDDGDYAGGYDHQLAAINALFKATRGEISLAFGASSITVTYNGATTIPANTTVRLQLDRAGDDTGDTEEALADPGKMARGEIVIINLGAPVVADPDGVCESQSGAAGALTLDGALVANGVATFDVPRNIVIDSGGADTATLRITGTDVYGNTIVEDITLNGTTAVAGAKAFKTVTSVVSDATISNGAFVGTGDVLGLPVFLPSTAYVLAELEDNADATAGTLVAGVSTAATATTGDVRGTYDPNSAADGAADFQLIAFIPDPSYKGVAQFAG